MQHVLGHFRGQMDVRLWSLKCPGLGKSGRGVAVEAFSQSVKIAQLILQWQEGI